MAYGCGNHPISSEEFPIIARIREELKVDERLKNLPRTNGGIKMDKYPVTDAWRAEMEGVWKIYQERAR